MEPVSPGFPYRSGEHKANPAEPSATTVSPGPLPVTAIIPAHNEAPRIGAVLSALRDVPLVRHILVVDDGSTDGTAQVVQRWAARDSRVRLLRLPENRGKGAAMVEGARRSPSDIVLFLDADLVGLKPHHVEALIWPVLRDEADMTVGLFRGGRFHTDWSHLLTPFLSGQRCLRWSLFARTPDLEKSGWGAETAFHLHAAREHLRLEKVFLEGVTQVTKEEKAEFPTAARARARMYGHILRYVASFIAAALVGYGVFGRLRARGRRARPLSSGKE